MQSSKHATALQPAKFVSKRQANEYVRILFDNGVQIILLIILLNHVNQDYMMIVFSTCDVKMNIFLLCY